MKIISIIFFVFCCLNSQGQIFFIPIQSLLVYAITDKYTDDELYQQYLKNDTSIVSNDLNEEFMAINLAIKKDQDNPDLFLKRAFIRRKAGLYTDASSDFSKSLELAKIGNRSSAYKDSILLEKIIMLSLVGNTENCIKQLDLFLDRHPKNSKALLYKGLAYFCFPKQNKKENYHNAINCFDDLLFIEPNLSEIRLFNGLCYSRIKNYASAISEYSKVIELDPLSGIAYLSRGKAYLELNNMKNACEDFRQAEKNSFNVPKRYISKSCK